MKKTILFCSNHLNDLIIFRGDVIRRYIEKGYKVIALVPYNNSFNREIPYGLKIIYKPLTRSSVNIVGDLPFLKELRRLISSKPYHVFSYTIKPNLYCVWLCKYYDVPLTAMVPGIGYVGNNKSITAKFGKILYKGALKRANSVLTLNTHNRDILINDFRLMPNKVKLLEGGEGVDLNHYKFSPLPNSDSVSFLMIGRILADKGYREYIAAAKKVQKQFPDISCQLLGYIDTENPEGISKEEIDKDVSEGTIEYLGYTNDVLPFAKNAHSIVLPSYHEGLSRTLIEAAALGRIIICSNISGCKETVDEGINGFLVPPKDSDSLAEAMIKVIKMPQEELMNMSLASRRIAEQEFGMDKVYEIYDNELKHE